MFIFRWYDKYTASVESIIILSHNNNFYEGYIYFDWNVNEERGIKIKNYEFENKLISWKYAKWLNYLSYLYHFSFINQIIVHIFPKSIHNP